MKLGAVFDSRYNALNAWRLILAVWVILWHSFLVTGREVWPLWVRQFMFSVWVDAFFAISGFLITASWLRHPRLIPYFTARALRILPGFYVCLLVTAFVMAPVGVALQGGSAKQLIMSGAPLEYVFKNSLLLILEFSVGGTPRGVPEPGMWNGSLWTIFWEVLCYIFVAVFGLIGLLKRRWFLPALLILALIWSAQLPPMTVPGVWTFQQIVARFAVMFVAGALFHQFRHRIPARWSLVAVSVVIVVAACILMPSYRLVGALPVAYAIIVSGALIHHKRMALRTDLSYGTYIYASPLQQLMVICGLGGLNVFVFFVISSIVVLPFAAASWFLLEKHALSLKSRLLRKWSAPSPAEARGESSPADFIADQPAPDAPGA